VEDNGKNRTTYSNKHTIFKVKPWTDVLASCSFVSHDLQSSPRQQCQLGSSMGKGCGHSAYRKQLYAAQVTAVGSCWCVALQYSSTRTKSFETENCPATATAPSLQRQLGECNPSCNLAARAATIRSLSWKRNISASLVRAQQCRLANV
jgi:hypothetical protein